MSTYRSSDRSREGQRTRRQDPGNVLDYFSHPAVSVRQPPVPRQEVPTFAGLEQLRQALVREGSGRQESTRRASGRQALDRQDGSGLRGDGPGVLPQLKDVLHRHRLLSEGLREETAEAMELWAVLDSLESHHERVGALREHPNLLSLSLARLLLAASKASIYVEPEVGRNYAELAIQIGCRLDGERYGEAEVHDLLSEGWVRMADAWTFEQGAGPCRDFLVKAYRRFKRGSGSLPLLTDFWIADALLARFLDDLDMAEDLLRSAESLAMVSGRHGLGLYSRWLQALVHMQGGASCECPSAYVSIDEEEDAEFAESMAVALDAPLRDAMRQKQATRAALVLQRHRPLFELYRRQRI
ncbi:MAG: hypothetical protein AAGD01_06935 [Acidobacteriota bacterium]